MLLNEIRHTANDEAANLKAIEALEDSIRASNLQENRQFITKISIGILALGLLYTVTLFAYVYFKILYPFERLEDYAEDIAGGNLEVKLDYQRENYFGAFTWAFDHMRKEIVFARNREKNAIESNKTIIATLSHDIKTPIASIRAYSEALEANIDASFEKRQQYTGTIIRKCDEVTGLVNDLVVHSLSELEKLDINLENIRIDKIIKSTVKDLEFENLSLFQPIPQAEVKADPKRVAQIIENLLNNSRKYAKGKAVTISARAEGERYCIIIRDKGPGIDPEDMPFIKEKFYRGKNVGDMPGSGLGLYIVDYIVKEMQGEFLLENTGDGLEAKIYLLKTS